MQTRCATLETKGIRCWIAPRDILPGEKWPPAIVSAINKCQLVVLIFSSNANVSPQVEREIQRAFEKGLIVIPLRVEDVTPSGSLDYYLGPVHWLDAITPPMERHIEGLAATVKLLISKTCAQTPFGIPARDPVKVLPSGTARTGHEHRLIFALSIAGCVILSLFVLNAWLMFGHTLRPETPVTAELTEIAPAPTQSPAAQLDGETEAGDVAGAGNDLLTQYDNARREGRSGDVSRIREQINKRLTPPKKERRNGKDFSRPAEGEVSTTF